MRVMRLGRRGEFWGMIDCIVVEMGVADLMVAALFFSGLSSTMMGNRRGLQRIVRLENMFNYQ